MKVSAVYGSSEVVVRVDCPDDDPDNCQQVRDYTMVYIYIY